jgi:hypothetical protein
MSEKSAQLASPSKGKFSSPIIEMAVLGGRRSTCIAVICADGYIALFTLDSFHCAGEYRVDLICDVASFEASGLYIGDHRGQVHRIDQPSGL